MKEELARLKAAVRHYLDALYLDDERAQTDLLTDLVAQTGWVMPQERG